MSTKATTERDWAEAARRCRLTPADVRMAKELGFEPRSLVKSIPAPQQPWKAPVADWIRDLYAQRQRRTEQRRRRRERAEGLVDPARSSTCALFGATDQPAPHAKQGVPSTPEDPMVEDDRADSPIILMDGDADQVLDANQLDFRLPPWPIRRVTAGMKRCSVPDAEEIVILFSDLLSHEPDPWSEMDLELDVKAAIQDALDGGTPLFLIAESDGLSPHYGRVTITRGSARFVLWEGGGSSCDETIAPTTVDTLLAQGRNRAQRLAAAYPTQPNVEAELAEQFGAPAYPWSPDHARRCKKYRTTRSLPRRCGACRARSEQMAATAKRLRARATREVNAQIASADRPIQSPSDS